MKIVPVVYDLIPISYPEYCSEDLVSLFIIGLKILSFQINFTISKMLKKCYEYLKTVLKKEIWLFLFGCKFKNNFDEKDK